MYEKKCYVNVNLFNFQMGQMREGWKEKRRTRPPPAKVNTQELNKKFEEIFNEPSQTL